MASRPLTTRDNLSRRYPPLLSIALIVVLALAVLPSALNLPQSNPATTLEYAPVPPSDEERPPPAGGNLASLGLASSGSLGSAVDGGDLGTGGSGGSLGVGKNPVTKRCVGNPPRQTEDPMAPPCVAFFQGDNGARTWRGVTRDEIRVLHAMDPLFGTPSDNGADDEVQYRGIYFDLGKPPDQNPAGSKPEPGRIKNLRRYQRHFNERYQTYGRFVRFYAYYMNAPGTAEMRRSDAADNVKRVDPFATVTNFLGGLEAEYQAATSSQGVLNFGSSSGQQEGQYYRRFPTLIWAYPGTVELAADLYASFVCSRVVNRPVVDSGNAGENGKPRRLGLLRTRDPSYPNLHLVAKIVRERVEACGGTFVAEGTFGTANVIGRNSTQSRDRAEATQNMANFQQKNVTTVIWPGGYEANHSQAAAQLNYRPEWLLFGEGITEGNTNGSLQDQSVWEHAYVVTQLTKILEGDERPCAQAIKEADPSTGNLDMNHACGRTTFVDTRQLFTGIQVAGPRVSPKSIDQGFHAIPSKRSIDPTIPACFYEPGDYTCVKDAQLEHWDPDGGSAGCWRMAEGGQRYLVGGWPGGNLNATTRPGDPCNSWGGSTTYTFDSPQQQ